jgi:hypothetical protein
MKGPISHFLSSCFYLSGSVVTHTLCSIYRQSRGAAGGFHAAGGRDGGAAAHRDPKRRLLPHRCRGRLARLLLAGATLPPSPRQLVSPFCPCCTVLHSCSPLAPLPPTLASCPFPCLPESPSLSLCLFPLRSVAIILSLSLSPSHLSS